MQTIAILYNNYSHLHLFNLPQPDISLNKISTFVVLCYLLSASTSFVLKLYFQYDINKQQINHYQLAQQQTHPIAAVQLDSGTSMRRFISQDMHWLVLTDEQGNLHERFSRRQAGLIQVFFWLYQGLCVAALGILMLGVIKRDFPLKLTLCLFTSLLWLQLAVPFWLWPTTYPLYITSLPAMASGASLSLAWLCWWLFYQRHQLARRFTANTLIAYASQSGTAASIAKRLGKACMVDCDVKNLAACQPDDFAHYHNALLVAATYGEGEPPENAAGFYQKLQQSSLDLTELKVAVLALGDRQYPRFCAFGHQLAACFQQLNATQLLPVQEVHRSNTQTINRWWDKLTTHLNWQPVVLEAHWQTAMVVANQCLNPATPARAVHHIKLYMPEMHYQPGDLLELQLSGEPGSRVYSIASAPHQPEISLLVRKLIKDDGSLGSYSGWLSECRVNSALRASIRSHPSFHPPKAETPLIMLAAGTGLAPFIGFLAQRQQQAKAAPSWLIMGERDPLHDNYFKEQLLAFKQHGCLTRLEHAWSGDNNNPCYVQDLLVEHQQQLKHWVLEKGACIYLCGKAKGFGESVETHLKRIFSHHWTDLIEQQQIHKDLY